MERLRPLILSPEYQALRKESQHYRKKWILERTGATHSEITWALLGATWHDFRYANELVERLPQDISESKGAVKTRFKRLRGELLRKLGRLDGAKQQFEEILAEEGRFTKEGLIARYELKVIAMPADRNLSANFFGGGVTVADVLAEYKEDPEVQEAAYVPVLKNSTLFQKTYVFLLDELQLQASLSSKVLWLPNGNTLATNAKDGIFIIDPERKDSKYVKNTYKSPRPKWSLPDEPRLLFATQKAIFTVRQNIVQLNAQTFDPIASTEVPCGGRWATVLLSHDERFVLCLLGDELVGRDIATQRLHTINFMPKEEKPSPSLQASDPSGPRVAYTYRRTENYNAVVSWDYEKNATVVEFNAYGRDLLNDERYWVSAVNYSQDGQKIFVTGYYRTPDKTPDRERECEISVWDISAQKMLERKTMPGEKPQLAVDPGGHYAALACDKTINIYDAKLTEIIETMTLAGSDNFLSMAFSPDGKKFAVRTARAVSVYRVGD